MYIYIKFLKLLGNTGNYIAYTDYEDIKLATENNNDIYVYLIDYEKYNKLKCNIIFSYCKEINKINFDNSEYHHRYQTSL